MFTRRIVVVVVAPWVGARLGAVLAALSRQGLSTMLILLMASLGGCGSEARGQGGEEPTPKSGPKTFHLLTFGAEAVDGVDVLVLTPDGARIEHKEWQPIQGEKIEIRRPLPRQDDLTVFVQSKSGRPLVKVIQQPRESNGYEAKILLDDGGQAGAAPLFFELHARKGESVPRPFNVVVITLDSLRADHLGCYGHERETSPVLDRFATTCVRFENAFSTSSFTPPSHASLLTSLHVGDHGLLTWNPLPDERSTLPELLAERGYRTGASVNLDLLSGQNLGQGIEWKREGYRDGREVVSDGIAFLREDDGRPFFLWLHFYDAHRPYGRAPGWADHFGPLSRGGIGDDEDHYNLTPADVEERGLDPDDLRTIIDRYDAGIAYTDAQLGPLLAELSTTERLRSTLVMVTADHGESLLDRPERHFTHDPFLYSEVTRIPLLVRFPEKRNAGRVVTDPVSLIDVAPTVLELVGLERPATYQGLSLLGAAGGGSLSREQLFHECWGWEELKAARSPGWLVLLDARTDALTCYRLSSDPHELRPFQGPPPPEARRLTELLRVFARRPQGTGAPPELDEETLRRLRELGYVR